MTHHHDHDHDDHDHSHDAPGDMTFEEKMAKLLAHWIKHNDDHAQSYRDWAGKARSSHLTEVAAELDRVAEMTGEITAKFQKALVLVKP
ncbi:MAG: hypothetical protein JEZ11_02820 [Desulfobacterales bacterium]|nr:hypothetical protein [Desulfobacterales bacterium]